MQDSKPSLTLMASKVPLTKTDNEPFSNNFLYISTIRALQYVTLTRPKFGFAVNKLV